MKNIDTIVEFPNYAISIDGKVWSDISYKFLKPAPLKTGYLQITLVNNKKHFSKLIHRLVLETFVGPCPPKMQCRHLDGDKLNNNLNNLCWGTRSENQQDRNKHGTSNQGEKNPVSKLTEENVKEIRKLYKSKELNQRQLADKFNITQACVSLVVNKKSWKHIWNRR